MSAMNRNTEKFISTPVSSFNFQGKPVLDSSMPWLARLVLSIYRLCIYSVDFLESGGCRIINSVGLVASEGPCQSALFRRLPRPLKASFCWSLFLLRHYHSFAAIEY